MTLTIAFAFFKRVALFLPVEVHSLLLSTTENSTFLARYCECICFPCYSRFRMEQLLILFSPCDIQANNCYIFPGFGFGLVMSGTIRVHDDMLLAACKYNKGMNFCWGSFFAFPLTLVDFL